MIVAGQARAAFESWLASLSAADRAAIDADPDQAVPRYRRWLRGHFDEHTALALYVAYENEAYDLTSWDPPAVAETATRAGAWGDC